MLEGKGTCSHRKEGTTRMKQERLTEYRPGHVTVEVPEHARHILSDTDHSAESHSRLRGGPAPFHFKGTNRNSKLNQRQLTRKWS
jgi:hypothetical protein